MKKYLCQILLNIMKTIFSSLELFSLSAFKARSNCIHFSHKKKLTSNHSKPIGVLTRTKSPCSDERLPIGYLLSDFQQNRSNFLNRFTSLRFGSVRFSLNQEGRGSTLGGGPRPPPSPPRGGFVPLTCWLQKYSYRSLHVMQSRFFGQFENFMI